MYRPVRKALTLIAGLLGFACAHGEDGASAENDTPSEVPAILRARIKSAFHYDAKAKKGDEPQQPADPNILVMKKVTVVGSKTDDLMADLARKNQQIEDEKFSLISGGTVTKAQVGNVTLGINASYLPPLLASPGGITLIKIAR